jgi:hypothetical protein
MKLMPGKTILWIICSAVGYTKIKKKGMLLTA